MEYRLMPCLLVFQMLLGTHLDRCDTHQYLLQLRHFIINRVDLGLFVLKRLQCGRVAVEPEKIFDLLVDFIEGLLVELLGVHF